MAKALEESKENREWRSKYLETIRELDRLEANFKQSEEILHRSIVRLTHFTNNIKQNDDFPDPWQVVRDLIREKPPAKVLEEKIKIVSDQLDGLGGGSEPSPCQETSKVLGKLVQSLSHFTADMYWDPEIAEKLNSLQSCADNAYAIGELLKRVNEFFEAGPISREEQKCILEVMESLTNQISCPKEDQPRLEAFQQAIEQTKAGQQSLDLLFVDLKELLAAVHLTQQKTQSATEEFLENLFTRLADLGHLFQHLEESNNEALIDSGSLENRVMSEVQDLVKSIESANDLPSAKGSVDALLDKLQGHMTWFHQQTETRGQQMEEETTQLKKKVDSLKAAAKILHKTVILTKEAALLDPLTGIYNRRALDLYLDSEYKRWLRKPSPISVVFCDIDHFKNINDTWGHKAGDQALKSVVKIIKSTIRQNDYLARYGGEEFVIILPETPLEAALISAENIRQKIEQTRFHFSGTDVRITVSCGIASLQGVDGFSDCFARADQALYQAKETGRNRCVLDKEMVAA